MDAVELQDIIRSGETSKVQFKREFDNQDKIAAEIIAMSNAKGGIIVFGVEDKTGAVVGLDYAGLQNTSNRVATVANELVKPAAYIVTEVVSIDCEETGSKKVLLVHIDEGQYKPYKDGNGTIWIKQGADKRKLTDNNEQIRLFQQCGIVSVDEMLVANTSAADIDKGLVDEYAELIHLKTLERVSAEVLYRNLNIVNNSKLTLGGLLFFGKNPQKHKPAFCVKAISFVGNSIGGLTYRDSRDILGTIPDLYKEGMLFFKQNLKYMQRGQNVNKLGILEISEIALEELLQNALVHRDYSKNAPIRLMIFDNRIEIVSPGCLPNSLAVENIKVGNAVVRNNLLASYCSKRMIYRGFGSGIVRALEEQPDIEFINDAAGEQFVAKIPREQIP